MHDKGQTPLGGNANSVTVLRPTLVLLGSAIGARNVTARPGYDEIAKEGPFFAQSMVSIPR